VRPQGKIKPQKGKPDLETRTNPSKKAYFLRGFRKFQMILGSSASQYLRSEPRPIDKPGKEIRPPLDNPMPENQQKRINPIPLLDPQTVGARHASPLQ
jgi:hypothetical protein